MAPHSGADWTWLSRAPVTVEVTLDNLSFFGHNVRPCLAGFYTDLTIRLIACSEEMCVHILTVSQLLFYGSNSFIRRHRYASDSVVIYSSVKRKRVRKE